VAEAQPTAPARKSPESKPAPGFRQKGKLDIPAFGVEASESQRKGVETALVGYLQALEEDKWTLACGHLLAATKRQLVAFAARLEPSEAESCGSALEFSFARLSKDPRNPVTEGVASLRVKPGSGAGFALFHGSDGSDYWMPMKVEGGEWKILSTAPTDLNASP
jgi:hypothetical protein